METEYFVEREEHSQAEIRNIVVSLHCYTYSDKYIRCERLHIARKLKYPWLQSIAYSFYHIALRYHQRSRIKKQMEFVDPNVTRWTLTQTCASYHCFPFRTFKSQWAIPLLWRYLRADNICQRRNLHDLSSSLPDSCNG